jgi:hypothetical protein
VIGCDKKTRMPMDRTDILHEPINQFGVDGLPPDQPTVVNEMRKVVILTASDFATHPLFVQPLGGIRRIGPEWLQCFVRSRHRRDIPQLRFGNPV